MHTKSIVFGVLLLLCSLSLASQAAEIHLQNNTKHTTKFCFWFLDTRKEPCWHVQPGETLNLSSSNNDDVKLIKKYGGKVYFVGHNGNQGECHDGKDDFVDFDYYRTLTVTLNPSIFHGSCEFTMSGLKIFD